MDARDREALEAMAYLRDFKNFYALLRITDRESFRTITFEPNFVQKLLYNSINADDKAGKPSRKIVLKARRFGISTAVQSIFVHRAVTRAGFAGLTVAHESGSAQSLVEISQGMYDLLPPALKAHAKEAVGVRGKRLKLTNRSDLKVETAGDKDAGRSLGTLGLHMSEVASWDHGHTVAASLRQIVPDSPGSLVVMESTPMGASGFFYDEYFRAKHGQSDYEALFYPWFFFPDYHAKEGSDVWLTYTKRGKFEIQDDEEELLRNSGLYKNHDGTPITDEQLVWRRYTIAGKCGGDLEKFKTEYPSDDTSCFLTSGRKYFKNLDAFVPQEPLLIGQMLGFRNEKSDRAVLDIDKKFHYAPRAEKHGPLHMFEEAVEGHKYVAAIDIAGVQTQFELEQFSAEDKQEREDWSVIHVVDCSVNERHPQRTVATWKDRVEDARELAEVAYRIGMYYNKALLAPEYNGVGVAVLVHLSEMRYPRIYQRTKYNLRGEPISMLQGWDTNQETRPLMLDNLKELLRLQPEVLIDSRLKEEMMHFIYNKRGREEAAGGKHDDSVMAAAIAFQVAQENRHILRIDAAGNPMKRKMAQYKTRVFDKVNTVDDNNSKIDTKRYPK